MALKALVSGTTALGSIPAAGHTSVFTHNSGTYAVVTKNQADQGTGGFVVLDISDPDNPTIVSEKTDSTTGTNDGTNDWELLNGALDVETVVIGGIPYAVIAQKLDADSSVGGFTIAQLTDGNGDITATSPSVVKQVKDGDTFDGSLNAALGGLAGLSTQTIGSTTYLFTAGTKNVDNGACQVYDLNKLISNDNSALIKEISNTTLKNPRDIQTFQKDGIAYVNITAEGDSARRSYMRTLSFEPGSSYLLSLYGPMWYDDNTDMTALGYVTNGTNIFAGISAEDSSTSQYYNTNYTNAPASTFVGMVSQDDSITFNDNVNQLTGVEFEGKYYYIAPNSGNTNMGLEAIEVNMSTGALVSEGSIAIDGYADVEGATFSSLDGATDFASFTVGSSVYGVTTAKTDQAVQIVRLIHVSSLASATYDFATGTLVFTGEDLVAKTGSDNDIDVSKFTFTGEDSNTYSLTSNDVEIDSATQFTISLNEADQLQLAGLLNKDGTSSGGGTTYDIAASSGWNPGNTWSPDDLSGNAITVSNVAVPTLTSASYDTSTGALVITGTNLPAYPGATNDLDVSKLTITGQGGSTYTLTSDDVELSSSTSATVTLNSTDQTQLTALLDQTGTSSSDGTTYNIAAADRWVPGADATVNSSDLTGNGITVGAVNVNNPATPTTPTTPPDPDAQQPPVNHTPINATTRLNTTLTGSLKATDPNGDPLFFAIHHGSTDGHSFTRTTQAGTLTVHRTTGQYTYTPHPEFHATLKKGELHNDHFVITISDGTSLVRTSFTATIEGSESEVPTVPSATTENPSDNNIGETQPILDSLDEPRPTSAQESTPQINNTATANPSSIGVKESSELTLQAFKSLKPKGLCQLSDDVLTGLKKSHLKTLSADELTCFQRRQLKLLAPKHMPGLGCKALNALDQQQARAFTEDQLAAMSKKQRNCADKFIDHLSKRKQQLLNPTTTASQRLINPFDLDQDLITAINMDSFL